MADLVAAVQALGSALDALEERMDERLADLAHQDEAVDGARLYARSARSAAGDACDCLAAAISDLKAILHRPPRLVESKE